tara:strand:+ start:2501 stop:3004 length:504 start_codon:yes stop_codon:yes gene_type:complete
MDSEHQRMVEAALRTQYTYLKLSFEALMDTHRLQFAELTQAREKLATWDSLQAEVTGLQESARIARENETATALRSMDAESRAIASERTRIAAESQHLKELNMRSQAAQERVRELTDLRRDLEAARQQARSLKRELAAAETAERALQAYCDRLEEARRGTKSRRDRA